MKRIGLLFLCLGAFLWAKPSVSVSILPQKYFVEQIAGDTVDVNVMVQPGNSPATYEPKPSQMRELSKSSLYFAIGVPFERTWLAKFADNAPNMRIVHTDEDIQKQMMAHHEHEDEGDHHDHKHHEEDEHDGVPDPHIWLDPILVKAQASTITKALVETYPQYREQYEANLRNFHTRLDELDKTFQEIFSNVSSRKFMIFHPTFGYFASRYNLEQVAIEIEGKDPKPAQLAELIEHAKEEGIRFIFVAPQFSTKSAQIIAKEISGEVVSLNGLAYDWEEEMHKNATILAKTLK
jgi:zinc transport system substrate-binding protein